MLSAGGLSQCEELRAQWRPCCGVTGVGVGATQAREQTARGGRAWREERAAKFPGLRAGTGMGTVTSALRASFPRL